MRINIPLDDLIIRIWAITSLLSFGIITTFMLTKVLGFAMAIYLGIKTMEKVFGKFDEVKPQDIRSTK